MQPSKPARWGTFQTLSDIVMWIFDDGVARPEGRLRLNRNMHFVFYIRRVDSTFLGM